MKVIGIDISKGVGTCCLLEDLPSDLVAYSRSNDFAFWHVEPKKEELDAIAELAPDLVLYEPTGGKYEQALVIYLKAKGVTCRQVPAHRLLAYRRAKGLPKDDHFDALAIAAYGLEHGHKAGFLIPITPPEIQALRSLLLQRAAIVKERVRNTNRLRLELAIEFPEAQDFQLGATWEREVPSIIHWLAQDEVENKGTKAWTTKYKKSIGTGISPYTRQIAQTQLQLEDAIAVLEAQIKTALARPEYGPYIEAMRSLDFTELLQAWWLTRIFPFDRFMDTDGSERISTRQSSNGKPCTQNASLAQFKAALGAAVLESKSGTTGIAPTKKSYRRQRGKESDRTTMGCRYCRTAFWQWYLMRIETGKSTAANAKLLIERRQQLKDKGRNLYQRSGNIHGYACKVLYRELKQRLKE